MGNDKANREAVNILLVDDRLDGLTTLEAVLKSPDYYLYKAMSGQEALALSFDREMAVIVMDVQMPGMDGFETAALLRKRERTQRTPIIFVTAINTELQYVYRGYEAGGVDYLTKPFDPMVLASKVAVFAELYRKNRELQEKARLLAQSEARTRTVVESARDIIVTTSGDGTLTSINPAFGSILGWEPDEWLGKSFQPLVHPQDLATIIRNFHSTLQGEEIDIFEARFLARSGDFVLLESSARPLIQNGKVVGVLHISRDISARRQIEEEKRRRYELERSNRELDEFASICSHDLQEPLRLVVAFAQLLGKKYGEPLPEEAKDFLEQIISGTKRMSELVRDLLYYSRLGAPDLELAPTSAAEVLQETINLLAPSIRESDAQIRIEDLPVVMGNRSQLICLFQNLIGNAIKFRGTEKLSVLVKAEIIEDEAIFSLQDNGIGFEMAYANRIFQIFRRLHARDEYTGTGIGLASCKKIVERHGGRIWAEAQRGMGATFFFSLPLAKKVSAPSEARTESTEYSLPSGVNGLPRERHREGVSNHL